MPLNDDLPGDVPAPGPTPPADPSQVAGAGNGPLLAPGAAGAPVPPIWATAGDPAAARPPAPAGFPGEPIGVDVVSPFQVPGRRAVPDSLRKPSRTVVLTGSALVVAIATALLVWQPWNPSLVAPESVSGSSPTGASIRLAWPAPQGGAAVDHYVILRDGKQVALVPASTRTWTDTSVRPGDQHAYGVATADGGGAQSGSSPPITLAALTPAPSRLAVSPTYTSASLTWNPPANSPAPTSYVIGNDTGVLATIPGTTTSYTDSRLQPGTRYQYTVLAQWGGHKSQPTPVATGITRAAPLSGTSTVSVTLTKVPSGSTDNPVRGKAYKYSWTFDPTCTRDSCSFVANGALPTDPAGTAADFTVALRGSSATGYSGTTQGHYTSCGSQQAPNNDTLIFQVTPAGPLSNGEWTSWKGTLVDDAARNDLGNGQSCTATSWGFTLRG